MSSHELGLQTTIFEVNISFAYCVKACGAMHECVPSFDTTLAMDYITP
jgi:hypothetical protein